MAGPVVFGSFTTGSVAVAGNASDVFIATEGMTSFTIDTTGCDSNNTIKLQKRTRQQDAKLKDADLAQQLGDR